MGSVYAALVAKYIDGIDNLILCAPSHIPFEGSDAGNNRMTGHSITMYKGTEIPYVSPDFFNSGFMGRYVYDEEAGYAKDYKILVYPKASHLIGIMPSKEWNKWLYRAIPVMGLLYRSLGKHRRECMDALEQSEREIINFIMDI